MEPARGAARPVREPVYQQLNELLRELLRGGEFTPGDQFLTERQVAARFGVSRPTANKILSGLVSEGRLEFRKGIGTFVRGTALDYDIRGLVSFTRKAEEAGRTPSTSVLGFEIAPAAEAPAGVAEKLGVAPDEALIYMQRLRLAGGQPVILEHRWVPRALCPDLTRRDIHASIYTLWIERYGMEIAGADQVIRAVNIRAPEAALLGVRAGTAGFLVAATGFLRDGRALWVEHTTYRGDAYEFHHVRPAPGRLLPLAVGHA